MGIDSRPQNLALHMKYPGHSFLMEHYTAQGHTQTAKWPVTGSILSWLMQSVKTHLALLFLLI